MRLSCHITHPIMSLLSHIKSTHTSSLFLFSPNKKNSPFKKKKTRQQEREEREKKEVRERDSEREREGDGGNSGEEHERRRRTPARLQRRCSFRAGRWRGAAMEARTADSSSAPVTASHSSNSSGGADGALQRVARTADGRSSEERLRKVRLQQQLFAEVAGDVKATDELQ
ncbi:hypothetical protein Scep_016212 [Stephania cephalantha]|uniref:Uncharacterized protein n=1 Tax=Stephania cephalantha TaxID=152367 RepID=A0AAP0NTZ2_9MAGN